MLVKVDPSSLKQTKWHEYAVRFLLGGLITAAAGLIAKEFGPRVGGLFLAFPAIFPATATLAEKHEIQKKQQKGMRGTQRAIDVAANAALGTTIGSIALALFALVFWKAISNWNLVLVLFLALVTWAVAAVVLWFTRKRFTLLRKQDSSRARKAVVQHRPD